MLKGLKQVRRDTLKLYVLTVRKEQLFADTCELSRVQLSRVQSMPATKELL